MNSLFIIIGALFALLLILTLLLNFKKLKHELNAKLDDLKLFVTAATDKQEHTNKMLLDMIRTNLAEIETLKRTFEILGSSTDQKIEEFRRTLEERVIELNHFKEKLQNDFIVFQKVINPNFHLTNKGTGEMAHILQDQVRHSVDELTMELHAAKIELEKVQSFQLLRSKDNKEHQVQAQAARVKDIENRLAQFQSYLDNLNTISEFTAKSLNS